MDKNEPVTAALGLLQRSTGYLCIGGEEGFYGLVSDADIVSSVDPQTMLENMSLASMFESRFGFITLDHARSMHEAMREMVRAHTDSVIVTEEGKPAGIVTSRDILGYLLAAPEGMQPLSRYMSAPLQMLPGECSIAHALRFLGKKAFKRIVVSGADGDVIGIVGEEELMARSYSNWTSHLKERFVEAEEQTQELSEQNRMLTQMATHDALTGVANRYLFEELFEKERARVRRYGGELSLAILDIDRFKKVNDTYGHNAGDAVLRGVAALVDASIRHADMLARWGGEEFVLMLPESNEQGAAEAAEKLRKLIREHVFEEVGSVTASFGVVELLGGDTLQQAVERADRALYHAKETGRDRVVRFSQLN